MNTAQSSWQLLKAVGRMIADDRDFQAGLAQVIMAVAALAVRSIRPGPQSTDQPS